MTLTGRASVPCPNFLGEITIPGLQVARRTQEVTLGPASTVGHWEVTCPSYLHHGSLCPWLPTFYFLKIQVSLGSRCGCTGSWCWEGSGHLCALFSSRTELLAALVFLQHSARASFVPVFLFSSPGSLIYLFETASQWEPKCEEEWVRKCFLPTIVPESRLILCLWNFGCVCCCWSCVDQSPQGRHFICPPDLSFIRR